MPSRAASQFLALQVCLLLFNWSRTLLFGLPRSLPTMCPPLNAALSSRGLGTPRPFPSMVICSPSPPAWSLLNTGSFVIFGQPKEAKEGVVGKLRPRIKLPEPAILSPSCLGATKRLRCFKRERPFSLLSLPQLRGYTTGCPPERKGENSAAGTT